MDDATFPHVLVSPEELARALKSYNNDSQKRVVPLCAAWFLSSDGRKGIDVFHQTRIPGAKFLDLNAVANPSSDLPQMLPEPSAFASAMNGHGLDPEDVIVVYDSYELGIFSAPRAAWMLRVFGHRHVHVLNNFRLWVDQGYPTETGETSASNRALPVPSLSRYPVPVRDKTLLVDFEELSSHILSQSDNNPPWQILDPRPHSRWSGQEPELRPGLVSGHMPGSVNLLLSDVLTSDSRAFLSSDRLRAVLVDKGIDLRGAPIVTTCGSGITAAILGLAVEVADDASSVSRTWRLYDGSWSEWGQRAAGHPGLIVRSRDD